MKQLHHNFLVRTNMLIGAVLALLGFVGCHSQKNAAKNEKVVNDRPAYEEPVMCLYGVPNNVWRVDTVKPDTIVEEPPIEPIMVKYGAPRPMVKYGVPPSMLDD